MYLYDRASTCPINVWRTVSFHRFSIVGLFGLVWGLCFVFSFFLILAGATSVRYSQIWLPGTLQSLWPRPPGPALSPSCSCSLSPQRPGGPADGAFLGIRLAQARCYSIIARYLPPPPEVPPDLRRTP